MSFRRIAHSIVFSVQVTFVTLVLVGALHPHGSTGIGGTWALERDGQPSHLRRTDNLAITRQLFDLPHPFDFYNDACATSCQSDDQDNAFVPFLNACPKCPDKYEAQHCNHCCLDGASSIKLRWHGCPGRLRFASMAQGSEDCSVGSNEMSSQANLRFVDCACYDDTIAATLDQTEAPTCLLRTSIPVRGQDGNAVDICIVSVSLEDDGNLKIALSKPLPPVIGLVHDTTQAIEETSSYWVPYPLTTYFDTTCDLINDSALPFVLPIFPGYGKFPNTCPLDGLIDLQLGGSLELPDAIDHFNGAPPVEAFWYEFIDGTSTAFWPLDDGLDDQDEWSVAFDPTFSTCACRDCASANPTPQNPGPPAPETAPPTQAPSPGRNPGPGLPPTIDSSPKTSEPSGSKGKGSKSPHSSKSYAPYGKGGKGGKTSFPSTTAVPSSSSSGKGGKGGKTSLPSTTAVPSSNPSQGRNPGPGAPPTAVPPDVTSKPSSVSKSPKTPAPSVPWTFAPTKTSPSSSPSQGRNPGPDAPPIAVLPPMTSTPSGASSKSSVPHASKTSQPSCDQKASKTSAPNSPTNQPSLSPTTSPTISPSQARNPGPGFETPDPNVSPTNEPTASPSVFPTGDPTSGPTTSPTQEVTKPPTRLPTWTPTVSPLTELTDPPTIAPTPNPTPFPTDAPTPTPTRVPTSSPTAFQTDIPTTAVSDVPTPIPTSKPTETPTSEPTSSRNPGPGNCQLPSFASCFGFAFTQCFAKSSAPEYDEACEYNPNIRRKLDALKSIVDEARSEESSLKFLKTTISKEWVVDEIRRHVEASAQLAEGIPA